MERHWKDPEVNNLRAKCHLLEKEAKELEHSRRKLEGRLLLVQKQLGFEEKMVRQLKDRRVTELKTLRKDYVEKFETAMNLLKVRVKVEMNQSLRRHKEQLKMSFRTDLLKLTRKNCQLTNLLRYIQQLQHLEKEENRRRAAAPFCCPQPEVGTAGEDPHFQTLRTEFEKQIRKLLDELKEREEGINELNKNVATIPHRQQIRSVSVPSLSRCGKSVEVNPSGSLPTLLIPHECVGRGVVEKRISSALAPTPNKNCSGGPLRHKNHRGTRESRTSPYDTNLAVNRRKRCNASVQSASTEETAEEEATTPQPYKRERISEEGAERRMRELDSLQVQAIDCNAQSYYAHMNPQHTHSPYQNQNVGHQHHHHYHQQCVGSGLLETLPEAESEDEEYDEIESISPSGGKPEELYGINRGSLVSSASPSSSSSTTSNDSGAQSEFTPEFASLLEASFGRGNKLQVAKSLEDFGILQQCEVENQKISVLESIIRELRDELKECKDQNELLEFRLLEMQELTTPNGRAVQLEDVEEEVGQVDDEQEEEHVEKILDESPEPSKVVCLPPNSSEAEYERGNGHANVTESRSSCSDCSESLSLQESGIFDSQSTEDSPVTNICRLTISRELVSLTFQIEELLRRFNEGVDDSGSGAGSPAGLDTLCVSTRRGKTSHDLASELYSCRQRIQEFERRLAAMSDGNYIQGLEEKVNFLLHENRRLEDERAEIEEAENDNRLMCQRLEEKLGQLQKKKLVLQNRLSAEKKCIEQLRLQILQTQEREDDLCTQITRLEGLLQNYEQRNFELEESCIEMKCSVQFVINSIPIFALCYYGSLWGKANWFQAHQLPNFLLTFPPSIVNRYIQARNALPPVPDQTCGIVLPSRKHKLGEFSTSPPLEDVEPKLKKLRGILDKSGITCICDCAKCGGNNSIEKATVTSGSETQTGEELWKDFMEQMFTQQKREWEKAERVLLKKIEILECDIDKCQEFFDQERGNLIKLYEGKLAEKESQLLETQAVRSEKRDLQEKWNCLIQELEQFALYLGKNLSEAAEVDLSSLQERNTTIGSKQQMISPQMTDSTASCPTDERLPAFINTSFPTWKEVGRSEVPNRSEIEEKTNLISSLQASLREHLNSFEKREKHLLDEIDRLTKEMKESREKAGDTEQDNMIAHLSQENERLMSLFQEHEKCWADLQQLQEEHEKLKLEAGNISAFRKKIEESQKLETEMRDRLEELERSELNLKGQLTQLEKREQKGLEKIQQLRDEIQFLRTKCCQLQDDVDGKMTKEAKYKSEIQALTIKLKESSLELEEKESQLESNESALQAQIQKLKSQLGELHQAYGETECSNGMLREEVSYLERTVEEAIAKAVQSENTVTALSHELKQKDLTIEELQRKLERLTTCETIAGDMMARVVSPTLSKLACSSTTLSPHDLADFNKNDGGLHGVARDVEEVVTLLQRCSQCDKLGTKLMDIVERLIVLIQILKTSQLADANLLHIDSLSRCESEEVLNPCMNTQSITEEKVAKRKETTEEEDLMIAKLQDTMANLTLQIHNLEDAFYIRQKETRDSYLTETTWWKFRCEEKNKLIEVLGKRIAQLCVTDVHGYFLEGILMEIRKVREHIGNSHLIEITSNEQLSSSSSSSPSLKLDPSQYFCPIEPPPRKKSAKKKKVTMKGCVLPKDFTCESLCSYLVGERKRVMAILEDALSESATDCCGEAFTASGSSCTGNEDDFASELEFRVLRKIGPDSLLVCWSLSQHKLLSEEQVNGYEISVNGKVVVRIPHPKRHKVVLFGLNFDEPLRLTLKCSPSLQESTITYIN